MRTLGERLRDAAQALASVSDTPRLDAEILLSHALGLSRAKLLAELREPYGDCGFEPLLERRLNFEPIAYILGEWEFFSLKLTCRAPILVPRPETEHLVEAALKFAAKRPALRVLDLCTGTGCVGITIAKNLPQSDVWAVDLNPEAVALARENVQRHDATMEVFEGDLFAALPGESAPFDIIVANPPYVQDAEWGTLSEVITRHEDPLALLSGADGLDCIRRIVQEASNWLRPGGLLALETGEEQGAALREILSSRGFVDVAITKDLAGYDRIASGIWR